MDRRLMFMEKFWPLGVVCPCPGAIYMYISIILKLLGQSKPNFMWSILGKGERKSIYVNGQGDLTKMAAMAINRKKTRKKSSSLEPEGQ